MHDLIILKKPAVRPLDVLPHPLDVVEINDKHTDGVLREAIPIFKQIMAASKSPRSVLSTLLKSDVAEVIDEIICCIIIHASSTSPNLGFSCLLWRKVTLWRVACNVGMLISDMFLQVLVIRTKRQKKLTDVSITNGLKFI
ncbi:hypothetical protein CERZMDRAFT_103646 [Cercospora zeae-maydis SCOH1-5]|uniref:Uncharacterized protein n=1 Tax=Cercospora zeae-maydis SCOH1-5 TaxID=717836 RepID=A0A6A6EV86_9PEZI|nr:hypothetical protein CERZMDRAFT_103646 [Cercospora zeae-maydis SCOH1-5]